MFSVEFHGPRRQRVSPGHLTRDDALDFLAKNASSAVSGVEIVHPDGRREKFSSPERAEYFLRHKAVGALLAPPALMPEAQANAVLRLLSAGEVGAIPLSAMAARYRLSDVNDSIDVMRNKARVAAEKVFA